MAEVSRVGDEIAATLPRVDVLVNNGGVSQRARAMDADEAVERLIMEVDYFGPVALSKAVLPSMLARQSGHIVVVSSVMGYIGTPGRSSYAAAKHAEVGFTRALGAECAPKGVLVHSPSLTACENAV